MACSPAFGPESDVLNQFGGLGRRILRDILAKTYLTDSPRGDIALSELQVLVEASRAFDKYRFRAQTNLTVGIAPLVNTVVGRLSSRRMSSCVSCRMLRMAVTDFWMS